MKDILERLQDIQNDDDAELLHRRTATNAIAEIVRLRAALLEVIGAISEEDGAFYWLREHCREALETK